MSITDDTKTDVTAGLDLLDFLFTIAISLGLTPEILNITEIKGLLSQDWVKSLLITPYIFLPIKSEELFNLFSFTLGLANLTLSWFGYHASVRKRPLTYTKVWGMLRFILDIILVILYMLLLLFFKNIIAVLSLIVLIYFLFVVWDIFKINEYKDGYKNQNGKHFSCYRKEYVSIFWFIAFLLLLICCLYFGNFMEIGHWVFVFLAIAFTFLYRINKYYPLLWEGLLSKAILKIFKVSII